MAELRDRFESHGFDNNGNSMDSKHFENALKPLIGAYSDFKKAYKEQVAINKQLAEIQRKQQIQDLGKALADLPKNMTEAIVNGTAKVAGGVANVGKQAIGSAVEGTIQGGANVLEAGLAMSGPVGYALAKTLNLGKMASGTISAFKQGWNKTGTEDGNGSRLKSDSKGDVFTKLDKNNFESLPTIKLWQAYMKSSAESNISFRKYLRRWEKKFNTDDKSQKAMEKTLKEIDKSTSLSAIQAKLISAGVVAGIAALAVLTWVGIGVYRAIKEKFGGRTGDMPHTPSTGLRSTGSLGKYASGEFASGLTVIRGFGGGHKGIDIGHEQGWQGWYSDTDGGAQVRSLTAGIAETRYQPEKGSDKKYVTGKDPGPLGGWGLYVNVVLSPETVRQLGFVPQKGKRSYIKYAHLSDILVDDGSKVEVGTIIGRVGKTGGAVSALVNEMVPHLHIELVINDVVVDPRGKNVTWSKAGLSSDDFITAFKELESRKVTDTSKTDFQMPTTKESQERQLSKQAINPLNIVGESVNEAVGEWVEDIKKGDILGVATDLSAPVILFKTSVNSARRWKDYATRVKKYKPKNKKSSSKKKTSMLGVDSSLVAYDSSLDLMGLADSQIADMNLAYNNMDRNTVLSGNNVVQPTIIQTSQVPNNTSEYNLNFDTQNDSTKALKSADKSLDYIMT